MCYMDSKSFTVYTKTDNILKILQKMLRLDFILFILPILLYFFIPFPKVKNKRVIGLMKYELGVKIIIKFVGLRAKKCAKKKINFENHKNCLQATQLENKIY